MHVLVTGCGGFLGSEIVRQLLRGGHTVVGISRGTYPDLVSIGMQHRRGDLADETFTMEAIGDVDAVVHTAAVAGVWGTWDHFHRINTVATEHVIRACLDSGIRTLVFTSSPSVTFDGQDQSGVGESVPYASRWLCHYPHTKALAERAVLSANRMGGFHTVALRPHLIWGDDDPHILPRLVDRARSGRLRIVGDGQNMVDTVHVTNAAAAHVDALHALTENPADAAGRAYFIAQDEPVNCWDWISQICRLAGVAPPDRRISFASAYRLGATLEAAYRIMGQRSEPPMTRFVAAQLARDHYFDISSARQRLGYRIRTTMADGLTSLEQKWSADRAQTDVSSPDQTAHRS